MKKLMVLSLVLAIGAVSSAALYVEVEGEMLVVKNDDPMIGGIDIGIGIVGAPGLAFFDEVQGAGSNRPASALQYNYLGSAMHGEGLPWGEAAFVIWADAVTEPFAAGNWLTVTFRGVEAPFEVQVFRADNFEIIDTATVPEPMTMGLLGLGALFLRRRK